MNIDLKKKARKGIFFKEKSQLKNNAIFGKTMRNVRKVRNIKLATTEVGKNCLVSEPNYHTTKFFLEIYYPQKRTQMLMNEPVYLGLLIIEISKTVMYKIHL